MSVRQGGFGGSARNSFCWFGRRLPLGRNQACNATAVFVRTRGMRRMCPYGDIRGMCPYGDIRPVLLSSQGCQLLVFVLCFVAGCDVLSGWRGLVRVVCAPRRRGGTVPPMTTTAVDMSRTWCCAGS